jgi:hypothetical protein
MSHPASGLWGYAGRCGHGGMATPPRRPLSATVPLADASHRGDRPRKSKDYRRLSRDFLTLKFGPRRKRLRISRLTKGGFLLPGFHKLKKEQEW